MTAVSRGIGKDPLVPECASLVELEPSRKDEVPMQIGFIRFGGICASLGLLDSGYREMMATGRL